jgi:hypothetical protein
MTGVHKIAGGNVPHRCSRRAPGIRQTDGRVSTQAVTFSRGSCSPARRSSEETIRDE